LTGRFRVIKATLDDVFGLTKGTRNAVGPAQLTNRLITLDIVDETLDVVVYLYLAGNSERPRIRYNTSFLYLCEGALS
jgi:hypothetical protein